jgi:hypothetical protein
MEDEPEAEKPAPVPMPPPPKTAEEKEKIKEKVEPETPQEETLPEDEKQKPGERRNQTVTDPLSFRNVGLSLLQTLSTISWIHLGLVPNPETQLIAKKLDEARKSIALFEMVYSQVKGEFPPEVNTEILRLLQDLKANYVNQL